MPKKPDYTVTGPDRDCAVESDGVGLSKATTFASAAKREVTYYVRDRAGDVIGRAERDEHGVVRTYRLTEER